MKTMLPIVAVGQPDPNPAVTGISARGYKIYSNWVLTNDPNGWEAILYAPDNSESYFSAKSPVDPQNAYKLMPIAGDPLAGFRLIRGDGSQDLYTLLSPIINAGVRSGHLRGKLTKEYIR